MINRIGKAMLLICLLSNLTYAQQTKPKCCDNAACRERVVEYARTLSGLANYLGNCTRDKSADSATLEKLRIANPGLYDDFIRIVTILNDYLLKDDARFGGTECFENALPPGSNGRIVSCWINHVRFNILNVRPIFPSTEFCGGWKKRFEISQGSTAFLSKTEMQYLGSARAYIIYTFAKKDQCGGKFRVMAGPGFFLRSRNSYLTLSSRVGYKLTDLKANVFSLGNLNLFGGYNSNFDGFNLAEAGLEVELGPFGVNVSANANTNNGKKGFLIGIFFGNKKRSATKK